ncbi:MAG: hypothetical protein IJK53_07710 [Erysipelotrichaceae bacterium]|nr:hypothetical protein [Erysipelotrichaceae bacterium]MBQ6217257.1 hypothetical protein [Erysipelotrichaceae bacterium]
MLTDNMSLRDMLDFSPSELDMAMLPLDIVVYVKVTVVSENQSDNYGFIRYLFSSEELGDYFKDLSDTLFYDFDGHRRDQDRFITIFELHSLYNYSNTSEYLKELLQFYSHEADVLIDLYTHDDHSYRLSNLDGIVKLEEMKKESTVS